ncbi:hypothetical protein AB0F13_17485 [Streptomyces sp. NPDC026206]|uniref:hypothetical protein n=1 Tax=Streptomyces sp. NPDC026206 TaxID=3157089 RepID=UPI003408817D
MHTKRIFAAITLLGTLVTLTACEGGKGQGAQDKAGATPAGSATPSVPQGPPSAASLAEAQKYVQRYASCESMGTDPGDKRLPSPALTSVGEWSVTERGVCSDPREHGELVVYRTSDMKEFQTRYKKHIMDGFAQEPTPGLFSRVFVGKDFVVTPTATKSALALARSGLRILTCNPTFAVPQGYKKEKALVEGCVLSDFVASEDGSGSVNHQQPGGDAQSGPSGQPGGRHTPDATGLGLPSAGSLTELKELVRSSVDCTKFTTDPADVSVSSIDYLPAVEGDPRAWGVRERGMCGYPAGAQRAHDLAWLDTVDDMATFQAEAKAAQLKDLQDDGRVKATASKVLVGQNIAVETNSKHDRHGLYQQQFLHLNCESGFSAPQGYRLEKALVPGCVLTNYEK